MCIRDRRNILKPLHLSNTGFGLDLSGGNRDAAVGYLPSGAAVKPYHLGWSAPAGGMHSTVRDLSKLAGAMMEDRMPLLSSRALSRELLDPVFVDHDGGTLFGTPWEMQFHAATGMLVRRKGGNVPGYTALLAFVPELQLSISMLWAGAVDEFASSVAAFDLILPPFVGMLKALQESTPQPQPRNASRFQGTWRVKGMDPSAPGRGAQIMEHNGMLVVRLELLGVGLYLREPEARLPDGVTALQLWVSRTVAPCLSVELNALLNQYLFFADDLASFSLPGYVPGTVWERVSF